MGYFQLPNFRFGLDARRGELTSQPGTLQVLNNAHINQGGEIEKRLAFVNQGLMPAGSFGFEVSIAGTLVFGSAVDPGGWPTGTTYQRLQHPAVTLGATFDGTKHAMTAVTCSTSFGGEAWVSSTFNDGMTFTFYNGTFVPAWVNGLVLSALTGNDKIAGNLRTQVSNVDGFNVGNVTNGGSFYFVDVWSDAGLDYNISPLPLSTGKTSTSGTITATKVSDATDGIDAVTAITSFQITGGSSGNVTSVQVSPDGSTWTEVLGANVPFITDNPTTAANIATQINNFISGLPYSASSNLNQVTVIADASLGATPNGFFIKVTSTGDICCDNTVFGYSGQVATNTCTSVKYNSTGATLVELLSGTITFATGSTVAAFVQAIAANVRANATVNATYTAFAQITPTANNLIISRRVCNSFVPPGVSAATTVSAGTVVDNHLAAPIVLVAVTISPSPAIITGKAGAGGAESGGSITLTATVAGGVAPITYSWSPVNAPNGMGISGSQSSSSVKITVPANSGSATFQCLVKDSGGVTATASVTVSFQRG